MPYRRTPRRSEDRRGSIVAGEAISYGSAASGRCRCSIQADASTGATRAAPGGSPRASPALLGLTWALIVLGALVRAHAAGLACPDWPLCFGELVPRFDLKVAFEWGHRVTAGVVSLAFAALAALALRARGDAARDGAAARARGRPARLADPARRAHRVAPARLLVRDRAPAHGDQLRARAAADRLRAAGARGAARATRLACRRRARARSRSRPCCWPCRSPSAGSSPRATRASPARSGRPATAGSGSPRGSGSVGLHLLHRCNGYALLAALAAAAWASRADASLRRPTRVGPRARHHPGRRRDRERRPRAAGRGHGPALRARDRARGDARARAARGRPARADGGARMRPRRSTALVCCSPGRSRSPADGEPRGPCEPTPPPGELGSICGFENPEDVAWVPAAGLLLVSQMRHAGAGAGRLARRARARSRRRADRAAAQALAAGARGRRERGADARLRRRSRLHAAARGRALCAARARRRGARAGRRDSDRRRRARRARGHRAVRAARRGRGGGAALDGLRPAAGERHRQRRLARRGRRALGDELSARADGAARSLLHDRRRPRASDGRGAALARSGAPAAAGRPSPAPAARTRTGSCSLPGGATLAVAFTGAGAVAIRPLAPGGDVARDIARRRPPGQSALELARDAAGARAHERPRRPALSLRCPALHVPLEADGDRSGRRGVASERFAHDGSRIGAVSSVAEVGNRLYFGAVFDDRIGVRIEPLSASAQRLSEDARRAC